MISAEMAVSTTGTTNPNTTSKAASPRSRLLFSLINSSRSIGLNDSPSMIMYGQKNSPTHSAKRTTVMEDAIDFSDMLSQIESLYIPGETYFVSWGDADYKVVNDGCERHSLSNPILKDDYLDLAAAYKLLKGDRKTTGLRMAADELNVNTDGYWHTAYDDAVNTSLVLIKLINDGWKPEYYFSQLVT